MLTLEVFRNHDQPSRHGKSGRIWQTLLNNVFFEEKPALAKIYCSYL